MVSLIENNGTILEPSCGNGAFLSQLPAGAIGLEIDANTAHKNARIIDYFDYKTKVDTIIGNPPYVKYQDIINTTKNKLIGKLDNRANLYLFFII